MDKLMKRIRCNPDGTMLIKRWDDGLIQTHTRTAYAQAEKEDGFMRTAADMGLAGLEQQGLGWETEIEY